MSNNDGGFMITGREQTRAFHVLQMRTALGLEITTGWKFSNKGSLVKHAIRCGYVADGTRAKRDAYAQLNALCVSLGLADRPLDSECPVCHKFGRGPCAQHQ